MAYKESQMIERVCDNCGCSFQARPYQIRTGKGRFCSHRCRAMGQPREDLETRFWKRIDKSGDCWVWTGYVNPDGYGVIGIPGHKTERTHRVAYLLTYGSIPEGMQILHRCDNPPCCNPSHLFIGSQQDNIQDMLAKRRNVAHDGENAPGAKLTQAQVDSIRASANGERGERIRLARQYGVRIQTICNILDGKTWKTD